MLLDYPPARIFNKLIEEIFIYPNVSENDLWIIQMDREQNSPEMAASGFSVLADIIIGDIYSIARKVVSDINRKNKYVLSKIYIFSI